MCDGLYISQLADVALRWGSAQHSPGETGGLILACILAKIKCCGVLRLIEVIHKIIQWHFRR